MQIDKQYCLRLEHHRCKVLERHGSLRVAKGHEETCLRTAFTSNRAAVTTPRNLEVFQFWSDKHSHLPGHTSLLDQRRTPDAQAHASAVDLSLCLSACGKWPCIPTTTLAAAATILLFFIVLVVQLAALLGCRLGPRVHASTFHPFYPIVSGAAAASSSFLGSSRRRSAPTAAAGYVCMWIAGCVSFAAEDRQSIAGYFARSAHALHGLSPGLLANAVDLSSLATANFQRRSHGIRSRTSL
ncbi:hypothetical protein IWX90DRAFT_66976 [Phyllosticta citrichinensis]|uniref:Uncharacterized protein n=1 Tax=Phyllosticta citrichinensis TaxID=1130410 RepID=A0ABR1XHP0_9PEZI